MTSGQRSIAKLGARLKELRGDSSSADIAKECGLSHVQILRYEKGEQIPPDKTLRILAEIFEVSYRELKILYYQDLFADPEQLEIVKEALNFF